MSTDIQHDARLVKRESLLLFSTALPFRSALPVGATLDIQRTRRVENWVALVPQNIKSGTPVLRVPSQ